MQSGICGWYLFAVWLQGFARLTVGPRLLVGDGRKKRGDGREGEKNLGYGLMIIDIDFYSVPETEGAGLYELINVAVKSQVLVK